MVAKVEDSLSFYHFHIIYDTLSFTGVSFCAALVAIGQTKEGEQWKWRLGTALLFIASYCFVSVNFATSLKGWDDGTAGRCYRTSYTEDHPRPDLFYLGFTGIGMFLSVFGLMRGQKEKLSGSFPNNRSVLTWGWLLPLLALLQYPVHVWSVWTLRKENRGLPEVHSEGLEEDSWGFGQIVAIVLLSPVLVACFKEVTAYRNPKPLCPHCSRG